MKQSKYVNTPTLSHAHTHVRARTHTHTHIYIYTYTHIHTLAYCETKQVTPFLCSQSFRVTYNPKTKNDSSLNMQTTKY